MKDTQKALILAHLKSGQSLTALDALHKFSCLRLAARVHQIRQTGVPVRQDMVKRNGKMFAEYYL